MSKMGLEGGKLFKVILGTVGPYLNLALTDSKPALPTILLPVRQSRAGFET